MIKIIKTLLSIIIGALIFGFCGTLIPIVLIFILNPFYSDKTALGALGFFPLFLVPLGLVAGAFLGLLYSTNPSFNMVLKGYFKIIQNSVNGLYLKLMQNRILTLVGIIAFIIMIVTWAHEPKLKFDSYKWSVKDDISFPNREGMVDNLKDSGILKGMHKSNVIELLGIPEFTDREGSIGYDIITDFGSDIDPVYTKTFVINFNSDSIVDYCGTQVWKK